MPYSKSIVGLSGRRRRDYNARLGILGQMLPRNIARGIISLRPDRLPSLFSPLPPPTPPFYSRASHFGSNLSGTTSRIRVGDGHLCAA